MSWWHRFSVWLLVLMALVCPRLASANSPLGLETRVGVFDVVVPTVVGAQSFGTAEKHPGKSFGYDENAPGYRLAAEGVSSSSFVYQLVDEAGDAVYYGLTNNPVVRLGAHARLPPGPFNGMQVISEALALPQAQALETSLVQQALSEGRFIYNIAESSVPRMAPEIAVPGMIQPTQTLLNPKLYSW